VESGNLAAFNGLKHEPYLTVPVDLNLVFIGFGGDGHHRLNLQEVPPRHPHRLSLSVPRGSYAVQSKGRRTALGE
jgi:hypothetical protein